MTRVVYGALPAEVFLNEENRSIAAVLGKALFNPAAERSSPSYPICGGDSFRFLGGSEVQCLLCSNRGTLDASSGTPIISIEQSNHEMFISKVKLLKLMQWLIEIKSCLIEKKKELKAVSLDCRQGGTWIKPPEKLQ